jgi:hypothetical protein
MTKQLTTPIPNHEFFNINSHNHDQLFNYSLGPFCFVLNNLSDEARWLALVWSLEFLFLFD